MPKWSAAVKPATSNATSMVFVVDHDLSVRQTVRLLAGLAGWQVETFASASRFMERPRVPVLSCLMLDVGLPDMNGLDIQRQLADRPEMQIIFFTGCRDVQTAVRAMKAGGAEFLTRPLAGELLLAAMRHALERSRAALARPARGRGGGRSTDTGTCPRFPCRAGRELILPFTQR